MKALLIYTTIIASFAVTGCSSNKGTLSESFGESVNHNAAVHILPSKYAKDTALTTDGERITVGYDRYKTGTVTKPSTDTTGVMSSGSGG